MNALSPPSSPPRRGSWNRAVRWLALILLVGACSGGEEPTRPPVVVITVDTLRADHLGCYGYLRPTSPHIDQLAEAGTRFDQAVTSRPRTGPSVASMLTGLYSFRHGVTADSTSLDDSLTTLAELLLEQDYRTAAFVSSHALDGQRSGLRQGFEHYDDDRPDPVQNAEHRERHAERTVARAVEWLDQVADGEAFFLWLHLVDPQGPYTPPEFWRHRFKGGRQHLLDEADIPEFQRLGTVNRPDYINRYDAEIAYADAMIGLFVQALKDQGHYDRSLVLLHADHGESLGEFGVHFQHDRDLYEPGVRVPLILKTPAGGEAMPAVCDRLAGLIDVTPTVLEVTGIRAPAPLDGMSLLPLAHTGGARTALLLERVGPAAQEADSLQVGLRTTTDKLLYRLEPKDWMRVREREYYLLAQETEDGNVYRTEDPTIMELDNQLMVWVREILESTGAAGTQPPE